MLLIPFSELLCEIGTLSLVFIQCIKRSFLRRTSLFTVIQRLSTELKTEKRGYQIAGECLNHVSHADYMALLAPPTKDLQTKVNIRVSSAGE